MSTFCEVEAQAQARATKRMSVRVRVYAEHVQRALLCGVVWCAAVVM